MQEKQAPSPKIMRHHICGRSHYIDSSCYENEDHIHFSNCIRCHCTLLSNNNDEAFEAGMILAAMYFSENLD